MEYYVKIQKVREADVIVDETLTLPRNTGAFQEGDIISITEKMDGANSSIYYDPEQDILRCFSSRNELDVRNQLRGFLPFVQLLDKEIFAKYPDYIFFGEWLVKHSIIYEQDNYNQWYLFSVYDRKTKKWLPQSFVKQFAQEYGFEYVHELYYGEFISWEHCFSFANSPNYGKEQEGIVIKNQTALEENRGPHILKYVNPSFKEIQKKNSMRKLEDPYKCREREAAEEYIRMIVTEARVMKMFYKLIDEGVVPEQYELKDMMCIVRNLPNRVYEDCVKEEPLILQKAGEYGGKLCNKVTIEIIKRKLGLQKE